ncbi:P-loop containing nucleoside triphosphate hydrolase protein [Fomitopsis serialis]|uniref:P-loop containing nucleoside triphosphate hydrolase protein n=1 Tax=Fomitopsis serialis TaxID=139415 RepID=UPI0020084CBB|nr:P-loop containing nucleoside triphosphate hydrolase protein [Neoantrodia serialis]KAH9935479.1 P-loop containing nucleoside triphosphate hydrolase protein [Neoantrodia serialis]
MLPRPIQPFRRLFVASNQATVDGPPSQSRDATTSSRYFSTASVPAGNVLVPNSSPTHYDSAHRPPSTSWQADSTGDEIPGLPQAGPHFRSFAPRVDPLSAPSGFVTGSNASHASFTLSSDESLPDVQDIVAAPSRARIIRRMPTPPPPPPSEPPPPDKDSRFITFKIVNMSHPPDVILAAWQQASGDEAKATSLLNDPAFKPPSATAAPGRAVKTTAAGGRVKEIDDANKAQRAAVREKGKKSVIYQRPHVESKPAVATPPASTSAAHQNSPRTPNSPLVVQPRAKRLKRKVVDSESEAESDSEPPTRAKRAKDESSAELRVLKYFNATSVEGLQELTGCSVEQANKIIESRPFSSVDDLRTKLGQGKKKAGPAGISPRMIEDCQAIFEGYGRVDNILQDCEQIGAELKAEISRWTGGNSAKAGRAGASSSRGSSISAADGDGGLALTSQTLADRKPSYYLNSQPSSISKDVQLKEYQLIGVNWLNLLYRKKLSCILADEMGLGKTIQVISFLTHLKEQGRKGPHLIVVPSSTLENWCREFQRFAPDIRFNTYYGAKDERPALRQELLDTMASKVDDGWEVLITTYNLAQGDEKDKKFSVASHGMHASSTRRYKTLLRYESRWRLLLTGTPLQNNLQELVQFADDLDSLRAVFKTKGDSKDQVLQELPKKSERIEWCEMTPMQRTLYNEALRRSRKTVYDLQDVVEPEPEPAGRGKAKKTRANARTKDKMYLENSSNVLMDLRKAASHPMLFRRRFTDAMLSSIARLLLKEPDFKKRGAVFQIVKEDMEVMTDAELQLFMATHKSTQRYLQPADCYLQAGKVKVLLSLLNQYRAEQRRILIFSQFTQILNILEKVLETQDIKYLVLTGSTPVDVRQTLVDEFTENESITVFLLSTKAGGMGINLTALALSSFVDPPDASSRFDQDFNPHNDRQAQDRAYRIGQKRDVDVVKLITKGSIEEDMLALGQTKLALDEAVAGEEGEEKVEREVKTSLMNVVRRKLETQAEEPEQEPVPEPEPEPESEPGRAEEQQGKVVEQEEATEVDDLGSPLSAIDDDDDA